MRCVLDAAVDHSSEAVDHVATLVAFGFSEDRALCIGGPMAATQHIEKFFSKADVGEPKRPHPSGRPID